MPKWGEVGRIRAGIIVPGDWMRTAAWSEVDAAAAQLPIAKARRIRPCPPADLAQCRRRPGPLFKGRLGEWLDSRLIFAMRRHRRKFARKCRRARAMHRVDFESR